MRYSWIFCSLLTIVDFLFVFHIQSEAFKEIVSADFRCAKKYESIFEKLQRDEVLNGQDIASCFPNMKDYANDVANLFNEYKSNLMRDDKSYYYKGVPFEMCACENASVTKRLLLVLCQVEDIVIHFKSHEKIVHTAFAEKGLLQTWLLVRMLIELGYNTIHLNLIGFEIIEYFKGMFGFDETAVKKEIEKNFKKGLPDCNSVSVAIYLCSYEYVNDNFAPKSHSFDVIDVGREEEGSLLQEVSPEEFDNYSLVMINKLTDEFETELHLLNVYLSSHIPVVGEIYRFPCEFDYGEEFCKELKNRNFKNRRELIEWIVLCQNYFKKCNICLRLSCSAPMDFLGMIFEKGVKNPIIYEMQRGVLRRYKQYFPDISLYVNDQCKHY